MDELWTRPLGAPALLLLFVQLALALAYAGRVRRARTRAPLTDAVFALGFAAGLVAVASPGSFRPLADRALTSSGLPAVLAEADARLEVVESIPPSLWNELRDRVGWPFEGESPVGPVPLRGDRTLSERALPALEAWVVRWMRTATWTVSTGALLVALAWRTLVGRGSRLRALEERVAALEAELGFEDEEEPTSLEPGDEQGVV